jgi:hypothetical protein
MTHDELLASAIEHLRRLEARLKNASPNLSAIKVDQLLTRRIRDAVVIYFDGDDECGRIIAVVDRQTGAIIKASTRPLRNAGE